MNYIREMNAFMNWLETNQKDLPNELIVEAFRIAVKNNARSMRYAERIMTSWLDKGIKTMNALRIHETQRASKAHERGREGGAKKPLKRIYTDSEIEAASDYIKNALSEYKGRDVLSFIRGIGYTKDLTESCIDLLLNKGDLVI
ncbi:MAG TPA: DnaD domain protein [Clostridia bacterium]|nr:DnaD domain protein [Clostridia bacterium]